MECIAQKQQSTQERYPPWLWRISHVIKSPKQGRKWSLQNSLLQKFLLKIVLTFANFVNTESALNYRWNQIKIERELSVLKYINHKIDTKLHCWSGWLNCNQKGVRWFYLYHEIGQAQPGHVNVHLWPVKSYIVSWPLQRPDTGSSACNMAPVLSRSIILFISAYWTDLLGYSSYITVVMIFSPKVKLR